MEMLGFEDAALHLFPVPKIDSFVVARAGCWRVDSDGFVHWNLSRAYATFRGMNDLSECYVPGCGYFSKR
jgi:hypothetical protein